MGEIQKRIAKLFVGGNSCGHNKHKPHLELDRSIALLPSFLIEACYKINAFFANPDWLPELNYANGSFRQMRSERREACILVIKSLFFRLDLATFIVGIPQTAKNSPKKGFAPLPLRVMQRLIADLGQRRFERAIYDLKKSGFLEVSKQVKLKMPGGGFQYFPCIRSFNTVFFMKLGFSRLRINQERAAASKRLQKKLAAAGMKLTESVKINYVPFYNRKSEKKLLEERDKKLLEFLIKCKEAGDWSPTLQKYYDELIK